MLPHFLFILDFLNPALHSTRHPWPISPSLFVCALSSPALQERRFEMTQCADTSPDLVPLTPLALVAITHGATVRHFRFVFLTFIPLSDFLLRMSYHSGVWFAPPRPVSSTSHPWRFLAIPSLLISNGPGQDARRYIHVSSCRIPIKSFFSRVFQQPLELS